jgi:hypothetical protein
MLPLADTDALYAGNASRRCSITLNVRSFVLLRTYTNAILQVFSVRKGILALSTLDFRNVQLRGDLSTTEVLRGESGRSRA